MAKNVTTWTPSTCSCQIEYEWDSEHPAETRMHTILSVKPCGREHPYLGTGEYLEGSAFHEHHVVSNHGREHWDRVVKDNPHWKPKKI